MDTTPALTPEGLILLVALALYVAVRIYIRWIL